MENIYEAIKRAQAGDNAAKEQIILENSGLIWSIVKRFHGRGEPEDLYQLGTIGLLKCIEKFDFSYDVRFSTYAVPMIMGEIKRFLRDDGAIKVSRSLKELFFQIRRLQEQILKEEDREPSVSEVAERLQVEKEQVVLAMEAAKQVESLYTLENGDEQKTQLIDRLAAPSENEKMLEYVSLKEAINLLDAKERQIITMRYFQDRTQTEVAKAIGISQVQVSRIEKRILKQMKEALK